jgi:hypothetical protein
MSKDSDSSPRHATLRLLSQGHMAWTWAWLTGSAPTPRRVPSSGAAGADRATDRDLRASRGASSAGR